MSQDFDAVVVGSGVAGTTVAMLLADEGWRVAVVDDRPFGGTCALRGCDPKKVLRAGAEVIDAFRRLGAHSIFHGGLRVDWPGLMRFKREFTDPVPESRSDDFTEAGITVLHGSARFTGPTTLEVEGEALRARKVVLAAGSEPRPLAFPGAGHLVTSEGFLALERLPERILFVGGGYVSLELAHIAGRCGARPTVLHRGEHILEEHEAELTDALVEASRAGGIEITLETPVDRVERRADGYHVHSGDRSWRADLVVHGAGRVPRLEALRLEAAGVERDARGVKVDEQLRSVSNPDVLAAGDATPGQGPPFTQVATLEGELAAATLLGRPARPIAWDAVVSVVFTLPPLASVGLTEAEANARQIPYLLRSGDAGDWFASRRVGQRHARYKLLLRPGGEGLLGAHLLGEHADEVINVLALAIAARLPIRALLATPFGYPTGAYDLRTMVS